MFQPLGDLLRSSIKSKGFHRRVENALLLDSFSKILHNLGGSILSEKARPLFIRDKVLTVACMSSVVAQEVRLRENEIIDELNKRYQSRVVSKLNYML